MTGLGCLSITASHAPLARDRGIPGGVLRRVATACSPAFSTRRRPRAGGPPPAPAYRLVSRTQQPGGATRLST
jgi:hypothetical protein